MKFPGYHGLKNTSTDDLKKYLDRVGQAGETYGGVEFVLNELARRDQQEAIEQFRADLIRKQKLELTLSPSALKWMMFVDGENFVQRGGEFLASHKLFEQVSRKSKEYRPPIESRYCGEKGSFLWIPGQSPTLPYLEIPRSMEDIYPQEIELTKKFILQPRASRATYYTSAKADAPKLKAIRMSLQALGFHPDVFHKTSDGRCKGVDISLARDFLLHGFQGNYDVAILVTGDGDFTPLVEEVKRFGRSVCLAFPGKIDSQGLSPDLVLACDDFIDLSEALRFGWSQENTMLEDRMHFEEMQELETSAAPCQ
jgi:uncharacterized LabA/DUF88 family protein